MHAVLAGGEIFRYPRSEEEYQEVAKHWQLTDDFKALLVANLRNPTDARIDAVLDWAHRICFGGVSREDIAKGSVAMEQVLFDLVVDRKIAIVDLRDGQPVFEALRRDPTWR